MKLELPEKIFGVESFLIKIYVVPLAIVIMMVLTIVLAGLPKLAESSQIAKKVDKLIKDRKELESKKSYLMNLDQESIIRDSEYLNMAMLQNKDAYVLVNVIRTVAEKYQYAVDSFSITPGEVSEIYNTEVESDTKATKAKQNDLVRIPVRMVLMGPESGYMDVIKALEMTLPILSLDKMDYKLSNGVVSINLVASSYFSTEKTNSKIAQVTLEELMLTEKENELVRNISEFNKIEGVTAGESGLIKSREFTKFDRGNPFSL